jgi:hypothetical protein
MLFRNPLMNLLVSIKKMNQKSNNKLKIQPQEKDLVTAYPNLVFPPIRHSPQIKINEDLF